MSRIAFALPAALLMVLLLPAVPARAGSDEAQVVLARPECGFNYPYILRVPLTPSADRSLLLVETNNTGTPSDDPDVHLSAALELSKSGLGGKVADELGVPILMPVSPRPRTDWRVYTHMLDRDTLEIGEGPMRRLDLQLIAMISDARQTLAQQAAPFDERVLLTGFSASAKFANRSPFDSDAWRRVPQFLFMGAEDTNDALAFGDAYSEEERTLVYEAIGRPMLPLRWDRCQAVYADAGASAIFRTYAGIGHGTNGAIRREVAEFFRSVLSHGTPPK